MAYNGIDTIPKRDGGQDDRTYVVSPTPAGGLGDLNGEEWSVTELDDGGVELGAPAVHTPGDEDTPDHFDDNLVLRNEELAGVGYDVIEGIESDLRSRTSFMNTLTEGIELLGLEIEESSSESEKSGRGGISKVSHTTLIEAVVRSQSAARAELLPADGPVKVKIRHGDTSADEQLARDLADDMNYYLTTGAPEYYPDMDRGIFHFFYSGNLFKKVYSHPLRRRPVSETIAVDDLPVSPDAVDLDTALRVTQVGKWTVPQVQRMQAWGGWRDVDLGQPSVMPSNKVERREKEAVGINDQSIRPQDAPYTIYETLTDIDLTRYGIRTRKQPDGLPLPVRIVVEQNTKQVLGVWRAWRRGDEMFQRKHGYVHYGMVPAFDFLCLGFVHLLGNNTKALRAAWRILLDAGMFSNFPGGYRATGVRAGTNLAAPAPGEFVELDIGGMDDIRKALLIPPYKEPSPAFIQLCELITQDAQRLAGAIEFNAGEGRTNIPVGTMLAMIEQATQTMAVVHKRMHTAQARELMLLKECFAQNPQALWKLNPDPRRRWETAQEFEAYDLVPKSDPNVPAQVHRVMLALALVTLAQQNPMVYDQFAAHMRAWRMIGVNDSQEFLRQPQPQAAPPDPRAAMAQAKQQTDMAKLAQQQQESERKAANEALQTQQRAQQEQHEDQRHAEELASRERIASMQQQTERMRLTAEEGRARRQEVTEAHQDNLDRAERAQSFAGKLTEGFTP